MLFFWKKPDFILILLAIILQFFSCTGLYFIRSYADQADPFSILTTISTLTSTFLFSWFIFSFIGRISGAYLFGKYADKNSFFKVMRLVTLGHIFVAFLVVTICITEEDFYNKYQGFYLARFFYSSLVHVTVILPAMYLLNKYPESQHILISTSVALVTFLGKFLAYIFSCYVSSACIQAWYWIPVVGSSLALGIYTYVEKYSQLSLNKAETNLTYSVPSIRKKTLAALIGAACNAGIYYYYFFLTPYLADIIIVQHYSCMKGQSPFYTAFGLFLLPAAKVCQRFGLFNIIVGSLVGMLILGVSIPFMAVSPLAYTLSQIIFALFLAGLVAPSLAVLHQLFKKTKGMFDAIFWFSLGSATCMLCLGIGSRAGFALKFPLVGMLIFATSIAICLIAVYTYNRSEKLHKF